MPLRTTGRPGVLPLMGTDYRPITLPWPPVCHTSDGWNISDGQITDQITSPNHKSLAKM